MEQAIATRKTKVGDHFDAKDLNARAIKDPPDKLRLALLSHYGLGHDFGKLSTTLISSVENRTHFKKLTAIFDTFQLQKEDALGVDEQSSIENPMYYRPKIGEYLESILQDKID